MKYRETWLANFIVETNGRRIQTIETTEEDIIDSAPSERIIHLKQDDNKVVISGASF